ncbi:MAG: DUF134 domain-containing protein [Chloroflexi bacterium]|nr:DUF134 domain-containing protein [Chloroflexota bacterium]
MPRPIKWRKVGFIPEANYFKPAGIPMRDLEEVSLSIEELEAVRLKDQEGLQQEECAQRMGISRPTFHRVLGSARSKLADALTNGKAIRIEGGDFEIDRRRFRCGWDEDELESPVGEIPDEEIRVCFMCRGSGAGGQRCRRGHGHGW